MINFKKLIFENLTILKEKKSILNFVKNLIII